MKYADSSNDSVEIAQTIGTRLGHSWKALEDQGYGVTRQHFGQINSMEPEVESAVPPHLYFQQVCVEALLLEGRPWDVEQRLAIPKKWRSTILESLAALQARSGLTGQADKVSLSLGYRRWMELKYANSGTPDGLLWKEFRERTRHQKLVDSRTADQSLDYPLMSRLECATASAVYKYSADIFSTIVPEVRLTGGAKRGWAFRKSLGIGEYALEISFRDLSLIKRTIFPFELRISSALQSERLSTGSSILLFPGSNDYRYTDFDPALLKSVCVILARFLKAC